MKAIKQIKKVKNNKVTLNLPPEFEGQEAEIIVISHEIKKEYNFNDLTGKLEWKGNAVKEQRKLRNEWD